MYEIWSVGHRPFKGVANAKVSIVILSGCIIISKQTASCIQILHGSLLIQLIQLVDSNFRLAPPPGCPRAIYAIMMSCWYVYVYI